MSHRTHHLLGCLLAFGMPSSSHAQSTLELRQEAEAHARAGGNLPWTPDLHLAWRHFRGHPQSAYFTAAQTSSDVTYVIGCNGHETRFVVLATISTTESWVRPDIPGDSVASAQTLRHEQTHFDMSEILARELRRTLTSAAGDLCPSHLQAARQLFDSLSGVSKALQARYDEETGHGTRLDAQTTWSRWVTARLDSLAAYAADISPPT
jgi:uncharacterized protein DUF922